MGWFWWQYYDRRSVCKWWVPYWGDRLGGRQQCYTIVAIAYYWRRREVRAFGSCGSIKGKRYRMVGNTLFVVERVRYLVLWYRHDQLFGGWGNMIVSPSLQWQQYVRWCGGRLPDGGPPTSSGYRNTAIKRPTRSEHLNRWCWWWPGWGLVLNVMNLIRAWWSRHNSWPRFCSTSAAPNYLA